MEGVPAINDIYREFQDDGLEILYVMVEDESGTTATENYCLLWQAQHYVEPPVVLDPVAHMWEFVGKSPGVGVIIDRKTMEIIEITTGGDSAVYTSLFKLLF